MTTATVARSGNRGISPREQKRLRFVAYDWHGGMDSPLYSFASTRGTVHSEQHRSGLLREIAECEMLAQKEGEPSGELRRLSDLVRRATVKQPVFPDTF